MKYLIDTHIILWWLTEPNQIQKKARAVLEDKSQEIYVSSVSFWELAIKSSLGCIELPHNILSILKEENFKVLSLEAEVTLGVCDLPLLHKDPFDRMLISQAKYHDMVLITRDKIMPKYPLVTMKG